MKNIDNGNLVPKKRVWIKILLISAPLLLIIASYLTAIHVEVSEIRKDGGYYGVIVENGKEKMTWKTIP